VGKNITKENGNCLSAGGQGESTGGLWIEGTCDIPFYRFGTLVCKAHRRYFVGGVKWSYTLPKSNTRIPVKVKSTINGIGSANPINFFVSEKNDNAELVESTLTLLPTMPNPNKEPFISKVYCSVRHVSDFESDEVGITITVKGMHMHVTHNNQGESLALHETLPIPT